MSIHTRMKPRNGREKDLLKYGRRQGREQVIEVAQKWLEFDGDHDSLIEFLSDKSWYVEGSMPFLRRLRLLIKGENK